MITFLSLLLGLAPAPWVAPGAAASVARAPNPPSPTEQAANGPQRIHSDRTRRAEPLPSPVLALTDTAEDAADRWFAEDKLKHFFMSFAATSFAFGTVRTAGLEGTTGLIVAGGATAVLGVGKEWYDRENGGPFSKKDLAWDAVGIAAALLVAAGAR